MSKSRLEVHASETLERARYGPELGIHEMLARLEIVEFARVQVMEVAAKIAVWVA